MSIRSHRCQVEAICQGIEQHRVVIAHRGPVRDRLTVRLQRIKQKSFIPAGGNGEDILWRRQVPFGKDIADLEIFLRWHLILYISLICPRLLQENAGEESKETAITITIGDTVLDGVIYDTALAQEIKEYFPLTISMSGFGGREYYGGVDFYPADENLTGGGNTFANGDITYCEAHHNMAIFYAQTDNPVLSVDVIPIGRVTSDLSVFESLDSREEITFSLAE